MTNIEADDIVDLHATEEGVFDTELVADVLAGETDEFFFGDEVPTTGFPTNTWVNFFLDTETDTGANGDDGEALEATFIVRPIGTCSATP